MTSKEALDKIKHIDLHGQYPYPYYLKDDLKYKEAIETLEKLVERDTDKKVIKALEKAQKQEKLLELYRYLNENTNDYDLHFELVDEIHNEIDIIEKQIKEIENEKI